MNTIVSKPLPSGIRLVSLVSILMLVSGMLITACGHSDNQTSTAASDQELNPAAQNELAAHGTPTDASAQLDKLVHLYVDAKAVGHEDDELQLVSMEAFLQGIESDRQLLERVRGVNSGQLSNEERIDQQLMTGLLETAIYSAEKNRPWENDGSIYVPANQIGRLLQAGQAQTLEQQIAALQVLLRQIPERIAAGKANLREPPQRFTEAAIFATQGTIDSLRNDAAALARQAGAAEDEFTSSLEAALTALDEYLVFLRDDLLPRSTGSWAIGKEHYDYILQHRWFLDADADDILARGQRAFEETEALAQEVSERIEPGKHWSEVYEHLKDQHPPADRIKQAYQEKIDAAQAFVIAHQIVTLPAGERVITVDTPPALRRSSPFGTFQSVDRFGEDLEGRLVLTPIEDWMTPQQQAERLRSHHDAWIPIIAVHEAYPGHHVAALKTRENPRLLRKVVQEAIFSEGWGLFTEELMYEQGFLHGDDVRLTQLRNRLWRAARVILDVSLHTGRMTFDEAVDFLAEKVRFERYAAQLEVGMYTLRPTYVLGYLIGMQEIMAIRAEYVEKYGEPSPPSKFYDQLLRVGSLPPVLVRASLFGNEAATNSPAARELRDTVMHATFDGHLFTLEDGRSFQVVPESIAR